MSYLREKEMTTITTGKQPLGQYFTTHIDLQEKVFEFIRNKPSTTILEPCIGRGDLIRFVADKSTKKNIAFDMYEIDPSINLLAGIPKEEVVYRDFMKEPMTNKSYQTIIGNPPYVRTKKGNLYIDFTEKCVHLLEPNGELIFIVPSDFLKLTSAAKLLNTMMTHGTFTHIFHPHNEKMFEHASIDVMVFRYCKNAAIEKKVCYNDKVMYITNSNGLITFAAETDGDKNQVMFQDTFDIYVGLVSGKEEVYKNGELGNMEVLNGEDKVDKYIYIDKFPCDDAKINEYLLPYKSALMERGIRKFTEKNWFEWGAPRNMTAIQNNLGKDCIYINNITRKPKVAFIGKVQYFGGGLIMLIPKKTCDLSHIVSYMNSDTFKENFLFSGRFKIGHRQISHSYIPVSETNLLSKSECSP